MTTIIHSNGSKWAGQDPDSIDTLIEALASYPLDRTFEAYGDFIEHNTLNGYSEPLDGVVSATSFFGNFHNLSHVFRITTDDPAVIEPLTAAIKANKLRPDYRRQPPPFQSKLLTIERKRFSQTQGEVLLTYNGERINQFGDDIQLTVHGWRGRDDPYWMDVARTWLYKRHAEQFEREEAA